MGCNMKTRWKRLHDLPGVPQKSLPDPKDRSEKLSTTKRILGYPHSKTQNHNFLGICFKGIK